MARTDGLLTGAAIGIALLEAASAQARPMPTDGMRVNARNTPAAEGDAYQTGRGLLAIGDVTGAMAAFRQALLEAPQSVDALNGVGICYDRLGRYDISRGYYDSALAIEPNSPLVLNNLGYSLYLQGQHAAAIPILQRAAEAGDPAVVAASRRVLALVSAQMREASARASTREALAEIAAPRAHIELASNGEQRLVLGGAAPDKALVAALGDDAALVTIARPEALVTTGAPPAIITGATATAEVHAEIAADTTRRDAGDLPTVVYLSSSAAATTRTLTVVMLAPDNAADARPSHDPRLAVAAVALPSHATARATPIAVRAIDGPALPRLGNRELPALPRRHEPSPIVLPVAAGIDPQGRKSAPAWLLTSRRADLLVRDRGPADRRRDDIETVAAFDSDLDELNRFAARMRGQPVTRRADADLERDEAVARLEALIARIRAA